MRSKLLNPDPPVAYAIVLDTGDEVMGELDKFVREHKIAAASVTAIGAFLACLARVFRVADQAIRENLRRRTG